MGGYRGPWTVSLWPQRIKWQGDELKCNQRFLELGKQKPDSALEFHEVPICADIGWLLRKLGGEVSLTEQGVVAVLADPDIDAHFFRRFLRPCVCCRCVRLRYLLPDASLTSSNVQGQLD